LGQTDEFAVAAESGSCHQSIPTVPSTRRTEAIHAAVASHSTDRVFRFA